MVEEGTSGCEPEHGNMKVRTYPLHAGTACTIVRGRDITKDAKRLEST